MSRFIGSSRFDVQMESVVVMITVRGIQGVCCRVVDDLKRDNHSDYCGT